MAALLPAPRGGLATPAPTEVPSRPTAVGGRWVGEQYRPKAYLSPRRGSSYQKSDPGRIIKDQQSDLWRIINDQQSDRREGQQNSKNAILPP